MRMFLFAKRNIKEILRDPINLFFSLGFPLVLLALLSIINYAIPPEAKNTMFQIKISHRAWQCSVAYLWRYLQACCYQKTEHLLS